MIITGEKLYALNYDAQKNSRVHNGTGIWNLRKKLSYEIYIFFYIFIHVYYLYNLIVFLVLLICGSDLAIHVYTYF